MCHAGVRAGSGLPPGVPWWGQGVLPSVCVALCLMPPSLRACHHQPPHRELLESCHDVHEDGVMTGEEGAKGQAPEKEPTF